MPTALRSGELELTQAEVACLALALGYTWPLLLDGEAGLLHVSMDIDGAKETLAAMGALQGTGPRPHVVPAHFAGRVFSLLNGAPLRVHLVANRSGLRRTAFMGADGSDAAAIEPSRFETVNRFRLTRFSAETLAEKAYAWLGGFSAPRTEESHGECAHALPSGSLAAVVSAARRGDPESALEILAARRWDASCAGQFVLDAASDPAGYACTVLRHGGDVITVDEASWNCTSSGSWWEWEQDRHADVVRFTRSDARTVEHRVAEHLGQSA